MAPAAFKAVVRRAERLGCVRFAHVSARMTDPLSRASEGGDFHFRKNPSSRAPAIERPDIARVVASRRDPSLPCPLPHARNRAAARSRRSQCPPKPSSASRRIDRRSAFSFRASPVSLIGFLHFSVFCTLFYVYRYILCDYRDFLTVYYHEMEFAWI